MNIKLGVCCIYNYIYIYLTSIKKRKKQKYKYKSSRKINKIEVVWKHTAIPSSSHYRIVFFVLNSPADSSLYLNYNK